MSEIITVDYIPLNRGNFQSTKQFNVTIEELYGFAIMAKYIPNKISIILSDNNTIDIPKISSLSGNYSCELKGNKVLFNNLEFIRGAITLCLLFGLDPSTHITDISYQGNLFPVDFERYISQLYIPNFTKRRNDGDVIDLQKLKMVLSSELMNSLSRNMSECFPSVNTGFIVPSDVYLMTSDSTNSNIIALTMITSFLPNSLIKYRDRGQYIYSVCSANEYRGQGLAKSIMIAMINDYLNRNIKSFFLEVLTSNLIAYNLYTSIGFVKVDTTDNGTYDVLHLKL